jgi:hypothetical protein
VRTDLPIVPMLSSSNHHGRALNSTAIHRSSCVGLHGVLEDSRSVLMQSIPPLRDLARVDIELRDK